MSACQFVRLQQVVCVAGGWKFLALEPGEAAPYTGPHPEVDDVCTILAITTGPSGAYLVLDGYSPHAKYQADMFRPLTKRDPDIGDFHAILDLVNAGLVRAC